MRHDKQFPSILSLAPALNWPQLVLLSQHINKEKGQIRAATVVCEKPQVPEEHSLKSVTISTMLHKEVQRGAVQNMTRLVHRGG